MEREMIKQNQYAAPTVNQVLPMDKPAIIVY